MEFIYCIIYLLVASIVIYLLGRVIPYKWINENAFPFKSFAFEKNGKIYEKLKIKKWKNKLPDASQFISKVVKRVPAKNLEGNCGKKIPILIKETCKAEFTHFIASVAGFYCCKIWKKGGYMLSVLYFIGNLPFILIQRYNRPRLKRAMSFA